VAAETLTPELDQPTELLSLGTYPLTPGGDDCVQIPERAIESLGPTDVFLTLQESSSAKGFPGRPNSFSAEGGEEADAAGCLDNAEDVFFRMFRFTDEGRSFIGVRGDWEFSYGADPQGGLAGSERADLLRSRVSAWRLPIGEGRRKARSSANATLDAGLVEVIMRRRRCGVATRDADRA
jgi:hypothetical protein